MSINEILAGGGISLLVLLTIIQIAPIQVNPWSAIARALGRTLTSDVAKELKEVKETQKEIEKKLDDHIYEDDRREADANRIRILAFNGELLGNVLHTTEDFYEVLHEIDLYELYCKEHPEYPNSRAVHAIANIRRIYDERLEKHDFVSCYAEK